MKYKLNEMYTFVFTTINHVHWGKLFQICEIKTAVTATLLFGFFYGRPNSV